MNSAQETGNGLNTAHHKRRGSLNISIAGGTPAQRSALRESLAALTDLRMEIAEISAPGQAPPQGDAVRILMICSTTTSTCGTKSCGHGSRAATGRKLRRWSAGVRRKQCASALSAGANEVLFMPVDPVDLARSLWTVSEINRSKADK